MNIRIPLDVDQIVSLLYFGSFCFVDFSCLWGCDHYDGLYLLKVEREI